MKRTVIILLAVLGTIAVIFGILAGTVWQADEHIQATTDQPSAPLVVIDPGVGPLVADDVDIQLRADGPVVIAQASAADIDAWVGELAVQHVSGLTSWDTLTLSEPAGEGHGGNPAAAEMFQTIESGEDTLTYSLSDPQHQWALLVATDGTEAAPVITLTWENPHRNHWMWPLVSIGGVLLALALVLWLVQRYGKRPGPSDETEVIYVAPLTPEEAEGLTRRQIREREREREQLAYQEARRAGKRNISVLTSHTIPVITAPLLDQHPERLTETGMAGGALVIPYAPVAQAERDQEEEETRFAPAANVASQADEHAGVARVRLRDKLTRSATRTHKEDSPTDAEHSPNGDGAPSAARELWSDMPDDEVATEDRDETDV